VIHNLPTPANRRGQAPLSQRACFQPRQAKAGTSGRQAGCHEWARASAPGAGIVRL